MNMKLVSLLGALMLLTVLVPSVSANPASECIGSSETDPETRVTKCTGVCSDQQPDDECTGVCTDGSCEPVCDLNIIPCQEERASTAADDEGEEGCDGVEVGSGCIDPSNSHDCIPLVPVSQPIYNPLTGAYITTIGHPAELCY